MGDLFQDHTAPLAEKLRPQKLEDVIGQDHLIGAAKPLTTVLQQEAIPSMILWGPPGCGKTTLARLLASGSGLELVALSAVFSGVAELRKLFEQAQKRKMQGKGTVLFIDEIHRFNRAQQDSLLPGSESGLFVLIGATTENPSFELNAALLSRCRLFVLYPLDKKSLGVMLEKAEKMIGRTVPLDEDARLCLLQMADGDGRALLSMAEQLFVSNIKENLDKDALSGILQKRAPRYDKNQDEHYNLISALHKSLRGSDCDAALYWLARMLSGGEDPRYILRRLLRFAYEDIGLADPMAAMHAVTAWEAYQRLGSPEGELAIVQLVIYLATSAKSNSAYRALKASMRSAGEHSSLPPPAHILNAPTSMMKELGYGKGYVYDHDTEEGFSGQSYFPEAMERVRYYHPGKRGSENEITKRLAYWDGLRKKTEGR